MNPLEFFPRTKPGLFKTLSKADTNLFVQYAVNEKLNGPTFILNESTRSVTVKMILLRIKKYNLNITFTDSALWCIRILVRITKDTPLLLIDCLHAYEGKIVDVMALSKLYPNGFYSNASCELYFTNLKDVKWRHID